TSGAGSWRTRRARADRARWAGGGRRSAAASRGRARSGGPPPAPRRAPRPPARRRPGRRPPARSVSSLAPPFDHDIEHMFERARGVDDVRNGSPSAATLDAVKIVIPGGTGQVGGALRRALAARGDDVVVLSRRPERLEKGVRHVVWDGSTLGGWADEIDGADAVVNLAGRSVSCRYTDANLRQMMSSRVDSTRVVGEAIAQAERPPSVWLQMSTATIYADARSRPDHLPHDESTGVVGGEEPDVPLYWEYSVRIARRWEETQAEA